MPKLKCTISYDGTNYAGFQIQAHKNTIQAEIERVLKKIHKGKFVRIYPSGRTDAGVHAKGQVFHFSTDINIGDDDWKKAFNTLLPNDIFVHSVEHVQDDFHAQYDALEKEYRYVVLNSKERDVFQRNYMYHVRYPLDIEKMNEACKVFKGTHDFTSFCSMRSNVKGDKIRTIYDIYCVQNDKTFQFTIRGNGFLHHMIRIMVGMILDVGSGKTEIDTIEKAIAKKDRREAGVTIPPEGLYLWKVTYPQ